MVELFKLVGSQKQKKRDDYVEEGHTLNVVVNETAINSSKNIETLYKSMLFKVF